MPKQTKFEVPSVLVEEQDHQAIPDSSEKGEVPASADHFEHEIRQFVLEKEKKKQRNVGLYR